MVEAADLSKKTKFTDEAKQMIASLDLSNYITDIEDNKQLDASLNKGMKKIIGLSVGIPLLGVFGLSVIFGICGGVIVSLVTLLIASLFLFDCVFRTSFFHAYESLKEPLEEVHTQALSDRIELLELRTGGLHKAAGYLSFETTPNDHAARIVETLRESSQGEKITDLECYCWLLKAVQNTMAKEVVEKERLELEDSLKEFAK